MIGKNIVKIFFQNKTLDGVRLPVNEGIKFSEIKHIARNVNKELYNKINELC